MSRYVSQGLLAVGLGLAATACGEPEIRTDLRPEGPPDVLAVLVQSPLVLDFNPSPQDPFVVEPAAYCKYVGGQLDPKAPTFVGDPIFGGDIICPDAEADFEAGTLEPRPLNTLAANGQIIGQQYWGIRVMFDELLQADRVETLDCEDIPDVGEICSGSFAETNPVTLTCAGTEMPYTGYYVPNGNRVTYPLGPSIYVTPDPDSMTAPTGSTCTLTLDPDKLVDKDGEPVPAADTSFDVQIADLMLMLVDPAPGDDAVISPDPAAAGAAAFVFNANLAYDEEFQSAVDPDMFQLFDSEGNAIPTWTFVGAYWSGGLTDAVYVFPDTATGIFLPGEYTATMNPGTIAEQNGGTLTITEAVSTSFAVAFDKTGQSSGADLPVTGRSAASGLPGIRISFNNELDPATVTADDFEFFSTTSTTPNMPIPFTVAVGNATNTGNSPGVALANIPNNSVHIIPTMELPLGTYAVRIKAGAAIEDVDGNTKTFGSPFAITYNVLLKVTRTIPSVAADGSTLVPANGNFDIQYSGTLDRATVMQAEFDLLDLTNPMAPVAVPFTLEFATGPATTPPALPPHPDDIVRIHPTNNLTPGRTYRVVMKPGTSLSNVPVAGFSRVTRSFATATNWTFTAGPALP